MQFKSTMETGRTPTDQAKKVEQCERMRPGGVVFLEGVHPSKPRPQVSPHAGNFWFLGIFGQSSAGSRFPKFHTKKSPDEAVYLPSNQSSAGEG